ncbi:helix-turn-helix domain-containing protein [Paenibacillus sp. MB22_1]|uniref:helix-turn-helix domain-containing protein n=1 Tax=unclassified Paenibacillus TaxID=185978 RepID=UPI0001AFCBAB|nr:MULTISPECIES: helix-turn-helix transcriptional regulator [unclassified Paenibacillus]EES74476.1 putative HTH-type transcriptional regulator SinR [Paenibacillus sp. oral taxon 786 str. D14]MCT2194734.1 helix-turn-helix domain-containing protein [Paenibacillus sp. p3-SID1389]
MNLPEIVGKRIREYRKQKNWTQEQLAEAASLHYSYIGGVERGDRNISLETLEKIAVALDVPAGDLFRTEVVLDKQQLLDEHMKLVSSRSAEEIALITKITRDVIWGMGMKS